MKNMYCSFLVVFLFGLAATAQAAPGDLDPTFGGTGKIRVGVGGGNDQGNAVARQSDGKLVVAGTIDDYSGTHASLVRYNVNGTLDTSFGSGGKVLLTLVNGTVSAVVILSDGKILIAGSASLETDTAFLVARFNANGTLDTSFSSNGIVITDFVVNSSPGETARAIAVQSDGKIIVAGKVDYDAGLARYNTNGTLDSSFNGNGKLTIVAMDDIFALGLQGSKIVVGGDTLNESALFRYNANGTLDNSFGSGGAVYLPDSSHVSSLAFMSTTAGEDKIIVTGAVTSCSGLLCSTSARIWSRQAIDGAADTTFGNGGVASVPGLDWQDTTVKIRFSSGVVNRILVAGSGLSGQNFAVVRFLLDGTPDTAFGSDGIVITDLGGQDIGKDMVIQPSDNKIVVAGGSGGDFAIVRYNSGGSLDTTFSGDGIRSDDVGDAVASAKSVAIQSDGKIIVAGDFAVARFNPDGTFDTSFGDGDGKVRSLVSGIRAVAIQTDGKILVAGSFIDSFVVARYSADGSPDASFSSDGVANAIFFGSLGPGRTVANAIAIQSDGAIVVAGYAAPDAGDIDFALVRFLSNGSPDSSFSTDGKVTTPIGSAEDKSNAVCVQPDGKILVAGAVEAGPMLGISDFGIVRYNPDGSLDTPAFNFDGKLTTQMSTGNDVATAIAIQGGKILVAGYASNGSNNDFALARYNIADGSLDTSFDGDGKLTNSVGTLNDRGNALVVQANGKFVVAGSSETATNVNDFAIVRYNADGSLDTTYGNGGKVAVNFQAAGSDIGYGLALDSLGRAVVVGEAGGLFAITRLMSEVFAKITSISRRASDGHILLEGLASPGSGVFLQDSPNLMNSSFQFRASLVPNAAGYWQFDHGTPATAHFFRLASP